MNFLHCFYRVGAVISPNIMALALKHARWNEGYRWTEVDDQQVAGIRETIKVPGVIPTLIAFFAYCSGEATCFLWTSSYFAGMKKGLVWFNGVIEQDL